MLGVRIHPFIFVLFFYLDTWVVSPRRHACAWMYKNTYGNKTYIDAHVTVKHSRCCYPSWSSCCRRRGECWEVEMTSSDKSLVTQPSAKYLFTYKVLKLLIFVNKPFSVVKPCSALAERMEREQWAQEVIRIEYRPVLPDCDAGRRAGTRMRRFFKLPVLHNLFGY